MTVQEIAEEHERRLTNEIASDAMTIEYNERLAAKLAGSAPALAESLLAHASALASRSALAATKLAAAKEIVGEEIAKIIPE